jgi:hypothetical protein
MRNSGASLAIARGDCALILRLIQRVGSSLENLAVDG